MTSPINSSSPKALSTTPEKASSSGIWNEMGKMAVKAGVESAFGLSSTQASIAVEGGYFAVKGGYAAAKGAYSVTHRGYESYQEAGGRYKDRKDQIGRLYQECEELSEDTRRCGDRIDQIFKDRGGL